MTEDAGFDRLRPRGPDATGSAQPTDPLGRRALYSVAAQPPSFGTITVECSACGRETPVTARRLLRLAVPSMHLPVVKRPHSSWMRCPACGERTWVSLHLHL